MPAAYLGIRIRSAKDTDIQTAVTRVLPFMPDRFFHLDQNSLEIYYWEKDPSLTRLSNWHADEGRAACMSGYGVHQSTGQPLQAMEFAGEKSFRTIWGDYCGEWSAMSFGGNKILAGSSTPGIEHLYMLSCGSFIAVSNRARILWSLLREFGEPLEPDWETLSCVLSFGHPICTNGSAIIGIELVPPTKYVEIRADSQNIEVHSLDEFYFLPDSKDNDWDKLPDTLNTTMKWLKNTNAPIIPAITGGMDTRLVLSALKSSGYLEKVRTFYIKAPENHADYIVARDLANKYNFPLERYDVPHRDDFFSDLRKHVSFTEGLLYAWDLKCDTSYIHKTGVHGNYGGVYSGNAPEPSSDPDKIAREFVISKDHFACILRNEIIDHQARKVRDWLLELQENRLPLSNWRDYYYLLQRAPRWMGQAKLWDGLIGVNFNPLYHPKLVKTFYALPQEDRTGKRIEFELMVRLWPELVKEAFANKVWNRAMIQKSTRPNTIVADTPVKHSGVIEGVGWQIPTITKLWKEIEQKILDQMSMLETIVNPKRVEYLLKKARIALFYDKSLSMKLWWRIFHQSELRGSLANQKKMIVQILSLLTILFLLEELRNPGDIQAKVV
jgi:hypothetical protein